MAWKKIPPEERREIERVHETKKKAKNRKPGPDDEGKVTYLKGDDLCAICDNGGDLVCCDGGCQRSFHLNEPKCRLILGLAEQQAKMITDDECKDFICKNCKYKQHQCFACGKLGSSDLSSGAEVFQCRHDDCARFYHPQCVAELLYPDREMEASLFEFQIAAGQGFKCPVHECSVCKGGEVKDDKKLQFAVCRRCPTTYHRKCLPRDILADSQMQRVWDTMEAPDGQVIHLNPILIYCTKHEIIKKLGTPKMNHIVFPKKIREPPDHPLPEPKVFVGPPIEEDIPDKEDLPDHPSAEPSSPPPAAARDQNQCSCSSPFNSFAPSYLFPHPHPGSGGWLGD